MQITHPNCLYIGGTRWVYHCLAQAIYIAGHKQQLKQCLRERRWESNITFMLVILVMVGG